MIKTQPIAKNKTRLQDHSRGTGAEESAARRLRFLVVDDDELNRNMMELMLAPLGHELEFAWDGAEALEAIKTRIYDLVFMDLILPDISGTEVVRQVREWEASNRHVPIVAVTAYDLPGQPLELIKAGMDDYIFKPYDLRGLSRIIELYARPDGQDAGREAATDLGMVGLEITVLDSAGSLEDFSNDVQGYKELLRDFLAGLAGRLERMRQAFEAADFVRLDRECHTLKGVSAGLGAKRLSLVAKQLGRACNEGRGSTTGPLLQQMEQAMLELQSEGQRFLRS